MPKKLSLLNSASKFFHGKSNELIIRKATRNCRKNGMSKRVLDELLASRKFYKSAHERALQCLNSNDSWRKKYNMAVEFDHLYIDCDDKSAVSRNLKLQGLKELNLLHLDLIQHQSEQLNEKDKVIKSLKQENQGLKLRLERVERKLALEVERQCAAASTTIVTHNEVQESTSDAVDQKAAKPTIPTIKVSVPHKPNSNLDSLPHEIERKSSKRTGRQSSPLPQARLPQREKRIRRESQETLPLRDDLEQSDDHPSEKQDLDATVDAGKDVQTTHHSLRSRNKDVSSLPTDVEASELTPESSERLQSPPAPNEKSTQNINVTDDQKPMQDPFLMTDVAYFISSPVKPAEPPTLDKCEEQMQVEIPRWRIRSLSSLYVMEGTENLENEVFLKRHSKPEVEERKRKRWDLQRIREQRQYEKLKERYEERNNPTDSSVGNHCSLWPAPESARFIQIDPMLPVCAFGQQLPTMKSSDFSLPWKQEEPKTCSKKKRHR